MDDSFIFLDNGNNSFKMYNANKSIDLVYPKTEPSKDINKLVLNQNNLNLNFCSQYLNLNHTEERHQINKIYIMVQIMIIGFLFLLCWSSINIINIFTTDSILSGIIFVLKFYSRDKNKYILKDCIYQAPYTIRLIYYVLLLSLYYVINFVTWYIFSSVLQFVLLIFILPFVIENIIYSYKFKKITKMIYEDVDDFSHFVISKQMTKVITLISQNCLKFDPQFGNDEFKPFVKNISAKMFINFICSFLFASLLHYLEQNGTTVYTAMFRQYYFRQYYFKKEEIKLDNKDYLIDIMKKRDWLKLLDPYTLNRVLQIYLELENEQDQNYIGKHIKNLIEQLGTSFSKIMVCWTVSSVIKIKCIGTLFYFVFVKSKHTINMYLKIGIISIFTIVSYFSYEQLLHIILCEICTRFMVNKVTRDVVYDGYKHIKQIALQNTQFYIKNNTIILSSYLTLSTMSYNKTNIMVTLFILTSIVRLAKIYWPSQQMDRIFIGMLGTLLFGYLSGYNIYHCLLLPYIFQIISNKENLMLLIKKKKII